MKQLFVILASIFCLSAFAEKQPISRYQSVIDRQMFGPLPPGFDSSKLPSEVAKSSGREGKELTKEQEQLKSSIHFSVINMTPEGQVAVGFTDKSDAKNPVHYYLKVGEERNGWKVVEADPTEASMTIVNAQGVEVSLTIGGDSSKSAGATKAGAASNDSKANSPFSQLRSRRAARQSKELEAMRAENEKLKEQKEEMDRRSEEAQQEKEANQALLQSIQEELKKTREDREKKEVDKEKPQNDDNAE